MPLLFAVSIPISKWHPLFPDALNSLANQNSALEIALLDASVDPRVAAAANVCGLSFAYRREGLDDGQSEAIAEGWENTKGDINFWLNADDCLKPGAINYVEAAFESDPDLAVLYGGSEFIDEAKNVIGLHNQVQPMSKLIYRSNIVSQPSCFVRRAWLKRIGGINRRLQYTMDWDLWVRLYAAGARFHYTTKILSQVFVGKGTKTSQVNVQRLAEIAALVNRNAGPVNALKAVYAFASHAAKDRV